MSDDGGERIAKVMARAGMCSRRQAERWIGDGRVKVDGVVLSTPAVTVTASSIILVDDKPLPSPAETRLWRYHKPPGLLTSHGDPQGRATVFDRLPREIGRVISIGRLDLNSEGLLLLTNDGELARQLELPATAWQRRYRVRVYGVVNPDRLAALAKGITIDGIKYGAIDAALESTAGRNSWLSVALSEGKNREIRKVLEHLKLEVNRLIRVSFGPFSLGQMSRGQVMEISGKILRDQVIATGAGKSRGKGWARAKKKPVRKKSRS
ncbi:MAG TPA: rRNA pseudouridine synthase [Rhodospirillales bacterium]|nr:rRNA pseudouridine synthase [Rhodospirillales bacterium]